jgi:hypothetical protein
VGTAALQSNTTASNNTAVGYLALGANTTGQFNTAVGNAALDSATTASYNTVLGHQAGSALTTGDGNCIIGSLAGLLSTGSGNTFVGAVDVGVTNGCASAMTTGSANTIIGGFTGNQGGLDIRTSSNNIVLSDGDGTPRFRIDSLGRPFCQGAYDFTTAAAANMYVAAGGGQLFRSTSSLRYKNTVEDATHGLTELLTLRSVTYKGNNDGDTIFGGLIAEEVHEAGLTEFVTYNDEGQPDALAYSNMVSLCIKAIQEQQALIESLTARLETLEGK